MYTDAQTTTRRWKWSTLKKLRDKQIERINRLRPSTIKRYESNARTLTLDIGGGELIMLSPSSYSLKYHVETGEYLKDRTFYNLKAAYQHALIMELDKHLKDADELEAIGMLEHMKAALQKAQACAQKFDAIQDYARRNRVGRPFNREERIASGRSPERQRTESKRRSMPRDSYWREKVTDNTKGHTFIACRLMAATGCRPDELCHPVDMELTKDGLLRITIQGSKCSDLQPSGQETRTLIYRPKTIHERELADMARSRGGGITYVYPHSTNALWQAVTKAAADAGFKPGAISPYSFRHQYASDLKALRASTGEGLGQAAIAQAMGHQAAMSQCAYGHWTQGGRTTGLESVEATTSVRGYQNYSESQTVQSHTAEASLIEVERAHKSTFGGDSGNGPENDFESDYDYGPKT